MAEEPAGKKRSKRLYVYWGVALALLVMLGLVCWTCSYFRISSLKDLVAYTQMRKECHPVWKDLAFRRLHAGQDLEEAMRIAKPMRVEKQGEFVVLLYQEPMHFTGIAVVAKDDRLVSAMAASCTWQHTFFDTMTEEERLDYYYHHLPKEERRGAAALDRMKSGEDE